MHKQASKGSLNLWGTWHLFPITDRWTLAISCVYKQLSPYLLLQLLRSFWCAQTISMSKHKCLVPYEWHNYYRSSIIEVILKKDITCDLISNKVTGIGINVNSVTAHLHYWCDFVWMKKDTDKNSWPDPNEYFGLYLHCDCLYCNTAYQHPVRMYL